MATYRITDVWTDIIKLGTVFHAHGAPGGSKTRHSLDVAPIDVRSRDPTDRHMVTVHTACTRTHALPGSIGQLEDDVIGQVVHFPQPEVVGDVVAVHERLKATTAGAHQLHTVSEN